METKSVKGFSLLYFCILSLHIVIDISGSFWHYLTKSAILLSLLVFFIKKSTHLDKRTRNGMILALLFSLLGDILLMFVSKSSHFFTGGLIAFLLAHIMYIVIFLKKKNLKQSYYIFTVLLIIYASGLFYLIKNDLGGMLVPVILYIVVILSMALSAFIREKQLNNASYFLVLLGAILFVISDSILALNKFYKPILYPQVSIMLTYGLAQFLITLGILKQER